MLIIRDTIYISTDPDSNDWEWFDVFAVDSVVVVLGHDYGTFIVSTGVDYIEVTVNDDIPSDCKSRALSFIDNDIQNQIIISVNLSGNYLDNFYANSDGFSFAGIRYILWLFIFK